MGPGMTERIERFGYADEYVIAPGAFAHQVGKVVPVKGPDGAVIGTATVVDGNGRVEITTPDHALFEGIGGLARARPEPAIRTVRTLLDSAQAILADAQKFLDRSKAAAGPAFDFDTWSAEWPGLAALIERTPPP
jgi:hypothetical protein